MKVNSNETKTMVMSDEENKIKSPSNILGKSRRFEEEINNKIMATTKLFYAIKNGFIGKKRNQRQNQNE